MFVIIIISSFDAALHAPVEKDEYSEGLPHCVARASEWAS
jgi:hypothetical protein